MSVSYTHLNWRGIRRIQFLGGPAIVLVLRALPVFLIALYGSEYIQTLINSIPTWAMNGLAAVGKMLPALGMSMLMKFMYKKALLPFFVLGFGIAAYSGMTDLLLYALVGVCPVSYTHLDVYKRQEYDLAQALQNGTIYAAALDVVREEPIRNDNPLLECDNCLITPHISWASKEARRRIMDTAVENLRCFLQGKEQNRIV